MVVYCFLENLWKTKWPQSPKTALFIWVHARSRFTFKCLLKFIIVVKCTDYPEKENTK